MIPHKLIGVLLDLAEEHSRDRPNFEHAYTREQMEKAIHALLMMYQCRPDDVGLVYAQAGLMNALGIDLWNSFFKTFASREKPEDGE